VEFCIALMSLHSIVEEHKFLLSEYLFIAEANSYYQLEEDIWRTYPANAHSANWTTIPVHHTPKAKSAVQETVWEASSLFQPDCFVSPTI